MTRDEIHARVQAIFRDVFDDDALVIRDASNAATIEDWDSLAHINLIAAIQKDFKLRFALGELETLKNVGDMLDLLQRKLA